MKKERIIHVSTGNGDAARAACRSGLSLACCIDGGCDRDMVRSRVPAMLSESGETPDTSPVRLASIGESDRLSSLLPLATAKGDMVVSVLRDEDLSGILPHVTDGRVATLVGIPGGHALCLDTDHERAVRFGDLVHRFFKGRKEGDWQGIFACARMALEVSK